MPQDFRKMRGASQSPASRAESVHDRDHPEDHLGRFYREIDRDVNALLKDGHPPLVVVGVEQEVALFHRLTTYPACVETGNTRITWTSWPERNVSAILEAGSGR